MAHLAGLTRLQLLDLGYCGVTDASLLSLWPLTQLTYLSLDSCQVQDAGCKVCVWVGGCGVYRGA